MPPPRQALIIREVDADNPLVARSSWRHAFWAAFWTFNLAVMGR